MCMESSKVCLVWTILIVSTYFAPTRQQLSYDQSKSSRSLVPTGRKRTVSGLVPVERDKVHMRYAVGSMHTLYTAPTERKPIIGRSAHCLIDSAAQLVQVHVFGRSRGPITTSFGSPNRHNGSFYNMVNRGFGSCGPEETHLT